MERMLDYDDKVRIILLFISSIVWLVFFIEATPWRKLLELRGKRLLTFLIAMYFAQCVSLWLYGFNMAYKWCKDNFDDIDLALTITFFNWFVWLVNTIASREALSRGYKKRGIAGLVACFFQLFVYLICFFGFSTQHRC